MKYIKIVALESVLYLLHLAVFTTPTACNEPFVWNTVTGPTTIAVGATPKTINVEIGATKNGGLCPLALDAYL